MTILDYITTHPGCRGGEIAAALNTPTTAINAELRRLWRGGLVIRTNRSTGGRARKTGGQASYHVNPMPFGCSNPLTHMFNQLLKEARA
ncbi:MarR family transcriptional regulator [Escherichia coli]|uniref:MarR family transcriptional regulator n=1 Tax=Escherichia coli TaxID=562 RepID=UPI003CF408BC